jgi:hypothetical protein
VYQIDELNAKYAPLFYLHNVAKQLFFLHRGEPVWPADPVFWQREVLFQKSDRRLPLRQSGELDPAALRHDSDSARHPSDRANAPQVVVTRAK